jgi:ribonuclease R
LKSVKGTSLEPIVANLMLRSLKLAVYATRNAGHFDLALKSYCHFTSPIRRYPDLVVHRSLKRIFAQKPGPGVTYDKLALHCSQQERSAEKAERESQKVFQLRFMEDKIGQNFEGTVRHLTPFGIFLELAPYGLEGFLSLESLTDDQYQLDQSSFLMKGRRGGQIQLNDKMKVQVVSVDMQFLRLVLQRIYG